MHNKETLHYIKYVLYSLKKTNIAFKQHQLIDSKLCRSTFYYFKFYAISHFVYCIWDSCSVVNYNTAYSKAAYNYLLKVFYNKTNKKKYDSQIWQYNVRYINIIATKNIIILGRVRKKEKLSKNITETTTLAEMPWVSSYINFAWRYRWSMSNVNLDVVKKLKLTGIEKYWKCASQVEMELDWLHNWIFALATFVRHSRGLYNNEKLTKNMKIRQNIDSE